VFGALQQYAPGGDRTEVAHGAEQLDLREPRLQRRHVLDVIGRDRDDRRTAEVATCQLAEPARAAVSKEAAIPDDDRPIVRADHVRECDLATRRGDELAGWRLRRDRRRVLLDVRGFPGTNLCAQATSTSTTSQRMP
jgi:hypothetical protein